MEAFSLLKYWRGGGAASASAGVGGGFLSSSHTSTTPSTLTAPPLTQNATDSSDEDDNDDDGPFFDLEFTVPDEADESEDPIPNHSSSSSSSSSSDHHSQQEQEEEEEDDDNIEESEVEREFKFTLSPSANDRSDLSPSDDLFFKGKLVQVDPSSFEPNSKPPQFTASLFKSATRFRVFMSGLKKPKSNTDSQPPNPESDTHIPESQKKQQNHQPADKKLFTVKFKVEEVPIMSLFTRDNSSKGSNNNNNNKSQNQKQNLEDSPSSSKEVMHKYLKMVKPLYIRVSRRYGDKLGFSGHLNLASEGKAAPPPATAEKKNAPAKVDGGGESAGTNSKGQKQGNLPAGLRVVCKHLGKSRSASSTVAAAPPPSSSKRRDDSLLQQQDGIQSAILHCKRSFNASRGKLINLFISLKIYLLL